MIGEKGMGKNQRFVILLILILFVNIFSVLFTPVNAESNEFIGYYEYTMYFDGYSFKGTAELRFAETTESISTYFGNYYSVSVQTRTNLKLQHSTQGYIQITDYKAYIDQTHYLRMTENKWKVRVSGYYEEDFTIKYEYGNYVTLQDTPSVFEETYTVRFYEDGYFQDSTACRDYMEYETTESVKVEAGSYSCIRFKTSFYEDGAYAGYVRLWYNSEDGRLIKQEQYDDSNNIIWYITLLSETRPIYAWEIALYILGGIGIVIVVAAIYHKRKKRDEDSNNKVKPKNYGYRSSYTTNTWKTYDPILNTYTNRKSEIPNPKCPLCAGSGKVIMSYGPTPCPFCSRKKI